MLPEGVVARAAELVRSTASDMDEHERRHYLCEALRREFPQLTMATIDCIMCDLIVRHTRGQPI